MQKTLANNQGRQIGAVLVIGLVVLLVLTLIGTSGINSVRMEERMTANTQDSAMAFAGAEAGLIQCETDLRASTLEDLDAVVVDVNDYATIANDGTSDRWWDDPGFWSDKKDRIQDYGSFAATGQVALADDPACVIEYVGDASPSLEFGQAVATETAASRKVYRVTGFSYGATERSYSVVESIYAR